MATDYSHAPLRPASRKPDALAFAERFDSVRSAVAARSSTVKPPEGSTPEGEEATSVWWAIGRPRLTIERTSRFKRDYRRESRGRQWCGIDLSSEAAELVKQRIADKQDLVSFSDFRHATDVPIRTDCRAGKGVDSYSKASPQKPPLQRSGGPLQPLPRGIRHSALRDGSHCPKGERWPRLDGQLPAPLLELQSNQGESISRSRTSQYREEQGHEFLGVQVAPRQPP